MPEVTPCQFHAGLAQTLIDVEKKVSAQEAYSREHAKQLDKLFLKVDELKERSDQNQVAAQTRDAKLQAINEVSQASLKKWETVQQELGGVKDDIKDLKDTVENGINRRVDNLWTAVMDPTNGLVAKVGELTKAVFSMAGCLERRKAAREANEKEFGGYKSFGKSIARRLNDLWEKNNLLIIFFIMWLMFGNDGKIIEHMGTVIRNILGFR